MNLTLYYHPLASYCWKVLIALHENGKTFETKMVNFGDAEALAAFKSLWPTAKIPLLDDDGKIIPETSIMIEYIDRLYPGKTALLPAEAEEQLKVRLWDRLFDSYVMDPMQQFVAQQLRPEAERDATGMIKSREDLLMAYAMIDNRMGKGPWAAGDDFTMADCAAAPALFYAAIVQPFPSDHDNLKNYFERLIERPSVKRVIKDARPYFQFFPFQKDIPARFLID